MNELALFAGAGGGILGSRLLGWKTVCAVEFDKYARQVLLSRQDEGCLDPFPIWDDVRTFDGRPWRGIVDVVSGGFPCQDISAAGKGVGITGERSGLWREMARIIGEVRPSFAFVENSSMLTSRGLGTVLGDLSEMGFNAEWGVLGADDVGAPHRRKRIWILAYAQSVERHDTADEVCDSDGTRLEGYPRDGADWKESGRFGKIKTRPTGSSGLLRAKGDWWITEPELGRVAYGVAHRMDRLRCIGNGQVPSVVRLAWNVLRKRI